MPPIINETMQDGLLRISTPQGYQLDSMVFSPAPPPPIKITVPTELQNMTLKSGMFVSEPGFLTGNDSIACLHYDLSPFIGYGKTITIDYARRSIYPLAIPGHKTNLKLFRAWSNWPTGKYPNIYLGVPDAAIPNPNWMLHTELFDPWKEGQTHFSLSPYPCGDGNLHTEHIEIQIPSAFGKADGRLKFTCDNAVYLNTFTWQMNGGPAKDNKGNPMVMDGMINWICIQDILANANFPAGSKVEIVPPVITVQ